jgi:hypothetical protein
MVRFMKINPKFRGGMLKTLKGLKPLIRRDVSGSGVRPPIGAFKQLAMSSDMSGGKVKAEKKKQSYGVKPLKFLM